MNKEEMLSYVAYFNMETNKTEFLYTDYYVKKLQQENQSLKDRIEKAIEYINNQMYYYDDGEDCGVDCCCDGFELLDLLKGDK